MVINVSETETGKKLGQIQVDRDRTDTTIGLEEKIAAAAAARWPGRLVDWCVSTSDCG